MIHPLFILFVIIALWQGLGIFAVTSIVAVLIHEFGHAVMANRFGIATRKLTLLPFGAQVNIDCSFLPTRKRVMILLSGSFANTITAVFCGALIWLIPQLFPLLGLLIVSNTAVAVLNLLPIYSFDGGKILQTLGNKTLDQIIKITSNILFAILLFYSVLISFNPTLFILSICILFSINTESKASVFVTKLQKHGSKHGTTPIKEVAIQSNMTIFNVYKLISASHFSKFIVTDLGNKSFYENDLEKWLLSNPLDTRIIDIRIMDII